MGLVNEWCLAWCDDGDQPLLTLKALWMTHDRLIFYSLADYWLSTTNKIDNK